MDVGAKRASQNINSRAGGLTDSSEPVSQNASDQSERSSSLTPSARPLYLLARSRTRQKPQQQSHRAGGREQPDCRQRSNRPRALCITARRLLNRARARPIRQHRLPPRVNTWSDIRRLDALRKRFKPRKSLDAHVLSIPNPSRQRQQHGRNEQHQA